MEQPPSSTDPGKKSPLNKPPMNQTMYRPDPEGPLYTSEAYAERLRQMPVAESAPTQEAKPTEKEIKQAGEEMLQRKLDDLDREIHTAEYQLSTPANIRLHNLTLMDASRKMHEENIRQQDRDRAVTIGKLAEWNEEKRVLELGKRFLETMEQSMKQTVGNPTELIPSSQDFVQLIRLLEDMEEKAAGRLSEQHAANQGPEKFLRSAKLEYRGLAELRNNVAKYFKMFHGSQ